MVLTLKSKWQHWQYSHCSSCDVNVFRLHDEVSYKIGIKSRNVNFLMFIKRNFIETSSNRIGLMSNESTRVLWSHLVQQLSDHIIIGMVFQNYYKAKHVLSRSFDAVIMCFTRVHILYKRTLAPSAFHTLAIHFSWISISITCVFCIEWKIENQTLICIWSCIYLNGCTVKRPSLLVSGLSLKVPKF